MGPNSTSPALHVVHVQDQDIGRSPWRNPSAGYGARLVIGAPVGRVRRGADRLGFAAAVVGAFDLRDQAATSIGAGRPDCHQDTFGTGIGETHLVHRQEPVADDFRQLNLGLGRHGHRDQSVHLALEGGDHIWMVVAVDQRRIVVDTVQARDTVGVDHPGSLALHGVERERIDMDRVPRISAGECLSRSAMQRLRCREFLREHDTTLHIPATSGRYISSVYIWK